jgi:phytoene synthase
MGAVYGDLLRQMLAKGWAPPRERVRVRKSTLLWLLLRHAL